MTLVKSQTARVKAAADAEDARWKAQSAELQKGSTAYKSAEAAHLVELSKINGTYRDKEYSDTVTHEEKKKQVTLLSEKEISLLKQSNDKQEELSRTEQLKQQIKYLDTKEDVEIKSIVRTTIARKTSEAEMVRLREQARQQIAAVDAKYDKERAAIYLQIETENQKIFLEKAQDTQDKIKVLTEKRLVAEAILAKVNAAKTEEERLAIIKEYDGKIGLETQNAAIEELKVQRDKSEKKLALIKAEKGETSKEYRAAYDQFLKDDLAYNSALTKQTIDGTKDRVKTIKDYEEEIRKAKKETADLEKDAADSQKKMLKDLSSFLGQIAGEQGGLFGSLINGVGVVIEHIKGLDGAAINSAKNTLDAAKKNLDEVKGMYDSASAEGAAAIADAERNVAGAEAGLAKAKELSFSSVLSIAGAVYQIFSAIADAYNKTRAAVFQAVADSYGKIIETFKNINEEIARNNREALDYQLQDTSLNLEQRKQLIDDYYAHATEQAHGQDQINAMLEYRQKAAQIAADAGSDIKKFMEGMTRLRAEQESAQYTIAIRDAENQIEQAARVRDATIEFLNQEFEQFKTTKSLEITAANDAKDQRIKAINDELAAFVTAKNAEVDALNASLDAQKAALGVFYDDKALRLQTDDVYRKQLLAQGEAREVQALEDAKQRELDRATSAEERTRITVAFDQLIRDKHNEYQTSIGDKNKEVSLASQELKKQETDKVKTLETDTKDEISKLKDQIVDKQRTTADDIRAIELDTANKIKAIQLEIANQQARTEYERKLAQQDYAEAKDRSERAIFENTKRLQVAQLDAEIAIVRAKRNFFGIGDAAINGAIDQLEQAKNQINGLSYSSSIASVGGIFGSIQGIVGSIFNGLTFIPTTAIRADNKEKITSAYDKAGNFLQISFNGTGKKITVYDKQGNPFDVLFADGYVPVTGEKFAKGTEYVQGNGYPDGIDTVPTWLTKGERVFKVDHNKLLAGLSNEDVVERVQLHDRLAAQFPQLLDPARWSDLARTTIALPPGIVNATGGTSIDIDGLRAEVRNLSRAIEKQPKLSISMDERGFSKTLATEQSQTDLLVSILTR